MKKDTSGAQKLKDLVHRTAPSIIREQLEEYLRCLKEGTNVELLTCSALTVGNRLIVLALPVHSNTFSVWGCTPTTRSGSGYALLPPSSFSLFDSWGDKASVLMCTCIPAEYSQGLILPRRGSNQPPVQQKTVGVRTKRENSLPTSISVSPASKPSGKG